MERPNKLWRQWLCGFRQNSDITQTKLQLGFAIRYFDLPTKWALIVARSNYGAWRTKVSIYRKPNSRPFKANFSISKILISDFTVLQCQIIYRSKSNLSSKLPLALYYIFNFLKRPTFSTCTYICIHHQNFWN